MKDDMVANSKTGDPEFNGETNAKERPMILSGSEVRGILAGTRSQLRRPVRLTDRATAAPADRHDAPVLTDEGPGQFRWEPSLLRFDWAPFGVQMMDAWRIDANENHGVPGDMLWVRESWAVQHDLDVYKPREIKSAVARLHYAASEDLGGLLVRSSVAMPRWASRLTLKITEVRVQRLQAISDADARAEGVVSGLIPADDYGPVRVGYVLGADDGKCILYPTETRAFEVGWDESNAKRASWSSNPWMWVITFLRVP